MAGFYDVIFLADCRDKVKISILAAKSDFSYAGD